MDNINVLMICYNFPPWAGGASVRTDAFARYLPQFGVRPTVLTIAERYIDPAAPLEPALIDRLDPQTALVRTNSLEPDRAAKARIRNAIETPGQRPPLTGRLLGALRRRVEPLVLCPDYTVLWAPHAVAAARRIARHTRIDVVYSAGPPYGALVVGRLIALALRRPLVIDIKDLWVGGPVYGSATPLRRALDRLCERGLVRAAARCIVVSPAARAQYHERYPGLDPQRFALIRNGVDPADFAETGVLPGSGRFVLALPGLLDELRDPRPLLTACRDLIAAGKIDPARLSIQMPGLIFERYRAFAAEHLPGGCVALPGPLPRHKYAHMLQSSHLLALLSSRGIPSMVPGKLYEYIFAQRPILALCEPGDAADLVREHSLGQVVAPDDRPGIAAAIQSAYCSALDGSWQPVAPQPALLSSIDRREQSGELAALLRRVAAR